MPRWCALYEYLQHMFLWRKKEDTNTFWLRNSTIRLYTTQLAFYVNLHRAIIGPSATLTGRWRPDIDLRRMLTGYNDMVQCLLHVLSYCRLYLFVPYTTILIITGSQRTINRAHIFFTISRSRDQTVTSIDYSDQKETVPLNYELGNKTSI